ncbi:two component transcriptional regulator, winged helix family [Roseovarius lutimaris]|jgi:two-component system, OmpR family, response regulator|uniref:Regulatory protein VirG n=1 Tax=Roseovarius lutimaris TaxID=1005928 RepID=A0A1I5DI40_9RHOB|nr:response regulator [Roseovarius lutimaris]SFN98868.1 two component transcriptional regulator, winged helix family [Roseovarius lutimaris]
MSKTPHILIVDDSPEIRKAVARYLEKNEMRVTSAAGAAEMDGLLKVGRYDLIILDVMMPGEDGISVCRRLSTRNVAPILMLTALGEEMDRIIGLEVGADDYLSKPFNPRELLARIKAILRRAQRPESLAGGLTGRRIRFAGWTLETDTRGLIAADGRKETLTTSEFKLLTILLERPRIVISREQLFDLTEGRKPAAFDRTIDNRISRLRRKIEDNPGRPRIITTVRNGGYCLATDVEAEA